MIQEQVLNKIIQDRDSSIVTLNNLSVDYFSDYKPKCMHRHGTINLKTALSKSCNYFFFELGRRVGAMTMTDYFKQFGLGVKTGVEVNVLTAAEGTYSTTLQAEMAKDEARHGAG